MGLANFLHWLDQSPARYWWTLVLCFGAMLLACVTPLFREPANPRARLWKKILDHDAWFCLS
ncbi:MAG: hypothetical protein M3Z64_10375, partial [Verrucomicrobiota bacterium]|nr:hypothetical protein [Verrucomicrobiota bacterium]